VRWGREPDIGPAFVGPVVEVEIGDEHDDRQGSSAEAGIAATVRGAGARCDRVALTADEAPRATFTSGDLIERFDL
jgi:hypothetical protein